ncbi:MAG: hypothetical protein EAY75_16760 [Bacteroidetes bacterium]|nr:MAG: hypothetical protein EAY75_16760 [Bacteroidota bacterium]
MERVLRPVGVVGQFTTYFKTGQPTKLKEKLAGREINLLLTLRFQALSTGPASQRRRAVDTAVGFFSWLRVKKAS